MSTDPRQVKDDAVRREVNWVRSLGREVNVRAIESSVDAGLQRFYARKREMRKVAKLMKKAERAHRKGQSAAGAMAQSNGMTFFKRPERIRVVPPVPCGNCGLCRRCKRELRVGEILRRAREGSPLWHRFAKRLERIALNGKLGLGSYFNLSDQDRFRRVLREIEDVCDATSGIIGEWRP